MSLWIPLLALGGVALMASEALMPNPLRQREGVLTHQVHAWSRRMLALYRKHEKMTPEKRVMRVEVEISAVWAKENPALFAQSFAEFARDYPADEWWQRMDLSIGRWTLIAERKEDL